MAASYNTLLKDIKAKRLAPVYVLHGDESFFIEQLCAAFETHVLEDHEKAFNLTMAYGNEADARTLSDAARRYPMGAERQLIIIKEADKMRGLKDLASYVSDPLPTTVMVICHASSKKKLDKRTKFYKAVGKTGILFESKKLYQNKVADWIEKHVLGLGLVIRGNAASMLGEYLGNDLSKIANEIDKIILKLDGKDVIELDDVRKMVGISREFNVFELQDAIGQGNTKRAFFIMSRMAADSKRHAPVMIVGSLYSYFAKLLIVSSSMNDDDKTLARKIGANPYFVKDYKRAARRFPLDALKRIIAVLYDFDLKVKGLGVANGEEFEQFGSEMLYKIFDATQPQHAA